MKFSLSIFLFSILFPGAILVGQKETEREGPVGIFLSRGEYNEFMGGIKQVAYGEDGSQELRDMIPMINDMVLGQEFGSTARKYGDIQNNEFDMLANPKIREDINMVDDQFNQLQTLNKEIQQRVGQQLSQLDLSDKSGLAQQIRAIRDGAREDLNGVLLPHQLERLRQLRAQSQIRYMSLVEIITSEPLKTSLEISDKQSQELKDAEKEIEVQLERDIATLRKEARERLMSNLKPTQKEQVKELFGDAFDFSKQAKGEAAGGKRNK